MLFLLPWVAAVILWRSHHYDADVVGVIIPVSFGSLAAWLAWAAYRGPKRSGSQVTNTSLGQMADQLAEAIGKQWTDEAAMRRLNDPYPLPISWNAADASLTDSWDSLVKLASSGAGWIALPVPRTWAAGPGDLAGKGGELADVLFRVPTGRLVVLGEPGAGKTMLMVRLVLDLIARRAAGGPVPFLASIASWNPAKQNLQDWLIAQLLIDHPGLASPSLAGAEPAWAASLLASGLILPILDGLDEIPEEVRGPAISRINDALRPGESLILTCRTEQYRDAIRPRDGIEVTLRAAGAIELCPLDPGSVASYLSADAGGPAMAARWSPVISVLGTATPAGQVLTTPLMIGLARAIYNPRPGQHTGELPDPAVLCSAALPDRAAIESHLFDAYIPAAYRKAGRWKARKAERWLIFLARHLEQTILNPNLAWWQLYQAIPVAAIAVIFGLMAFAVGLGIGLPIGPGTGLEFGICFGGIAGSFSLLITAAPRWQGYPPARGVRWRRDVRDLWAKWRELWRTVSGFPWAPRIKGYIILTRLILVPIPRQIRYYHVFLAAAYVTFGVIMGIKFGVAGGLAGSLGLVIVLSAVSVLINLLERAPLELSEAAVPRSTLARDRLATFGLTLGFGIAAGLMLILIVATLTSGHLHGLMPGLAVGLALGLLFGAMFLAFTGLIYIFAVKWPHFELARVCLALQRRVPWSLLGFLDDAHRRGVLRQAGAVYQFRHIELQHRLARRDVNKPGGEHHSPDAASHA